MLLPKKHKYSLFRVQALSHAIFNGIGQERKDISENCWDACGGGWSSFGGQEASSKAVRESRRCVSQKSLDLHGDCIPIFRYDGAYRNGGDCGAPSSLAPRGSEITASAGRTVGERKVVPGAFKGNASNTYNNLAWKVHGKIGVLLRISTQNAKAGVIVQGGA